ncbi:MAG TPA: hypothetical protein VMR34_06215 [Candidatus Saccharimonadales bacterium]|nr:hypothetical protein [Candidatus Saccharimonadales bacterium]
MLKKLLGNLAYNPSLIDGLPSYERKLKNEQRVRLLALLILLCMAVLCFFNAINPAKPSLSSSPNDLISGGFQGPSAAAYDCSNNIDNYGSILSGYGISCNQLNFANLQNLRLGNLKGFYSLSQLPYSDPERSFSLNNQAYYLRPISFSSSNYPRTYPVIWLTNQSGQSVGLMASSGNVISNFIPKLAPLCSGNCPSHYVAVRTENRNVPNTNGSTAKPGDLLIYTFVATNHSSSPIKNFAISVNLANLLAYGSIVNTYGGHALNNSLSWPATTIEPYQSTSQEMAVTIKNPIPGTPISSSDSNYFDLSMNVTYGNSVVVHLPYSFPKFIEKINRNLYNISPWAGLFAVVGATIYSGYFILRNYLTKEEIRGIKKDYINNDH